jgi:carbonic anhydrase
VSELAIENNNRPVQPLNGRVVELRRGAKCRH